MSLSLLSSLSPLSSLSLFSLLSPSLSLSLSCAINFFLSNSPRFHWRHIHPQIELLNIHELLSLFVFSDDDENGESSTPAFSDYVMHSLSFFWKVLFAFVPPTGTVNQSIFTSLLRFVLYTIKCIVIIVFFFLNFRLSNIISIYGMSVLLICTISTSYHRQSNWQIRVA